MLGTLVAAVLIVLASVVIGRTLMLALGWKRPSGSRAQSASRRWWSWRRSSCACPGAGSRRR